MTEKLFQDDAYLQRCDAVVQATPEGAVILDRSVFYPMGGGQPGDSGYLSTAGGDRIEIVDTRKTEEGDIAHILAEGTSAPEPGSAVEAVLDWERRYTHMRMHTGLHLLGAALPFPVTGGNISATRSRLDFDMEDGVDKDAVNAALAELIARDAPLSTRWITDEELDAQPELIRTMSVKPPRGAGRVRLLEIEGIDLQPCGGTHLKRSGEVGTLRVSKVEKKGRQNRRVHVVLED